MSSITAQGAGAVRALRGLTRRVARAARAQWYLRSSSHLARTVRLNGRPVVRNRGTLVVGDRVRLASHVARLELETAPTGTIEIGPGSFLNFGTLVRAVDSVRIGAGCQFGTYCVLADDLACGEPDAAPGRRPEPRPITIGENVWLASKVVVMPGVTIGAGSVVGGGSVVVDDVPPRTLVAGVPARVIRSL